MKARILSAIPILLLLCLSVVAWIFPGIDRFLSYAIGGVVAAVGLGYLAVALYRSFPPSLPRAVSSTWVDPEGCPSCQGSAHQLFMGDRSNDDYHINDYRCDVCGREYTRKRRREGPRILYRGKIGGDRR